MIQSLYNRQMNGWEGHQIISLKIENKIVDIFSKTSIMIAQEVYKPDLKNLKKDVDKKFEID